MKKLLKWFLFLFIILPIVVLFLTNLLSDKSERTKSDIGVNYEFKITQDVYPHKITYEINLDERVDKELIKKISEEIKTEKSYKNIFMFYNIPGWIWDGGGCWATSHYTPELEINILGASIEEVKKINSTLVLGNVISEWWLSTPYFEGRVLETENDNKNFIKRVYGDGNISTEQVQIRKIDGKVRYVPVDNKDEYWILEKNGNLSLNDNFGKLWEAKSIK